MLASDPLLNTRYNNPASRVSWIGNEHKCHWNASLPGVRVGSVRANNYGSCDVLPNGIQSGMVMARAADGTVYRTGVCTVTQDGNTVPAANTIQKVCIPPWITWNSAVGWQINPDTTLTFAVSNIFNKIAAIPNYAGGFEFIPTNQFADEYIGREMFLTYDYKLD